MDPDARTWVCGHRGNGHTIDQGPPAHPEPAVRHLRARLQQKPTPFICTSRFTGSGSHWKSPQDGPAPQPPPGSDCARQLGLSGRSHELHAHRAPRGQAVLLGWGWQVEGQSCSPPPPTSQHLAPWTHGCPVLTPLDDVLLAFQKVPPLISLVISSHQVTLWSLIRMMTHKCE